MEEKEEELTCVFAHPFEMSDYATCDLEGYIAITSSNGLSEERKLEIRQHCAACSQCQAAIEQLREKFTQMRKMGKPLRDLSYCPIQNVNQIPRDTDPMVAVARYLKTVLQPNN